MPTQGVLESRFDECEERGLVEKPCTGDHTHTPEVRVVLCGEGGVEKAHDEAQRVGVAGVGGEVVDEVNGTEEELR